MVKIVEYTNYIESVFTVLDELKFNEIVQDHTSFLIKPNLVNADPPPTTTDVRCVEGIVKYIRESRENVEIIIAEGSGERDTLFCFERLGYNQLTKSYDVKLVDLDRCNCVRKKRRDTFIYHEIYLPDIIEDKFFISVPVLKDHSICKVSLSIKNLIGVLPEKYYSGYWTFKKSNVHKEDVDKVISDLLKYIPIHFALIDGAIGKIRCHLSGPSMDPPARKIIAGDNPLEVDKIGAEILGHNWQDIPHLRYISEWYTSN